MNEDNSTQSNPPRANALASAMRMSIGGMMMMITIIGLAIALFLTRQQVVELERELAASRPLSLEEVARQFEAQTAVPPLVTSVKDVRYSKRDDAFRVTFAWTDRQANKTWSSDVTLNSDGFGTYHAMIRNGPFLAAIKAPRGFAVAVQTPSSFNRH